MGYDQLRLTPGAWLDLLGPSAKGREIGRGYFGGDRQVRGLTGSRSFGGA